MTNDYKENILKLVTGQIVDESQATDLLWQSKVETNVIDQSMPMGNYLRYKNNFILYGLADGLGTIVVTDLNLNKLANYTTYDSGTALPTSMILKIDDNGLLYGVNKVNNTLILLNNIVKDNKVVLRKAYTIPAAIVTVDDVSKIIDEATYIVSGRNSSNYLYAESLSIEVGVSPAWVEYTSAITVTAINDMKTGNPYPASQVYIARVSGNITIRFFATTTTDANIYWVNGTAIEYLYQAYQWTAGSGLIFQVVFKNNNEIYVQTAEVLAGSFGSRVEIINLDYFNLFDKTNIYSKTSTAIASGYDTYNYMVYDNGLILSIFSDVMTNGLVTAIVDDLTFYKKELADGFPSMVYLYGSINYNLIDFIGADQQLDNFTVWRQQLIYNSVNYNGQPYESDTMTIPKHISLSGYKTDELNECIVFDRNLYNLAIDDNITTATVEIPKEYINDIIINNQKVYSENNFENVTSTVTFTKNTLERVLYDDITVLKIDDGAGGDYTDGEILINNGLNGGETYANTKINKVRFIYDDASYLDASFFNFKFTFDGGYLTKATLQADIKNNYTKTITACEIYAGTTLYTTVPMTTVKRMILVGKNLFDKSAITSGKYISSNGTVADYYAYSLSDYIPINSNTRYSYQGISDYSERGAFYDTNKQLISAFVESTIVANQYINTPSNAKYVRFTIINTNQDINKFQLELGSTATDYEPYQETITNEINYRVSVDFTVKEE